ncbi:MAG: TetR/AcrR family transcriptional regulator [Archangium sp.]
MPRPRYENLDADKKQKLLDAATKEFAAHPYELASINTILEDAGQSKGSFYYYFDDKADLATEVFRVQVTTHLESLGELQHVNTVEEFWTELRRLSFVRLRVIEQNRRDYDAMIRIATAMQRDPQLATRIAPMFEESRKMMAGFFERGVVLGALRNDIPIGTLMALIENAKATAAPSFFPPNSVPTDAQLEVFTDLVLDLAKRIAEPKKER